MELSQIVRRILAEICFGGNGHGGGMLVFRPVHVVARFVGGEPEPGGKTKVRGRVVVFTR